MIDDPMKSPRNGFALILALIFMSFVLLLALGMGSMLRVDIDKSRIEKQREQARRNAYFALQEAIAQLQESMGPDQRISAPAAQLDRDPESAKMDDVGSPYWTAVWDSYSWKSKPGSSPQTDRPDYSEGFRNSLFRKWLVSAPNESSQKDLRFSKNDHRGDELYAPMVDVGTLGELAEDEQKVYSYLKKMGGVSSDEYSQSKYAWWIGDESIKANLNRTLTWVR
jgi:type II secretory pathway pseudopilin PulG